MPGKGAADAASHVLKRMLIMGSLLGFGRIEVGTVLRGARRRNNWTLFVVRIVGKVVLDP
jgi:hypothetical protein